MGFAMVFAYRLSSEFLASEEAMDKALFGPAEETPPSAGGKRFGNSTPTVAIVCPGG